MNTLEIGKAVYNDRTALTGYITEVKQCNGNKFLLCGGPKLMAEIKQEARVIWLDRDNNPNHESELDDITLIKFLEKAQALGLEPTTPEQLAEYKAQISRAKADTMREYKERRALKDAERQAFEDKYCDQVPVWAKPVIVGELVQDKSDSMTDYYHSTTSKAVILGFSKSTRDNFAEMRKFSTNYEHTAHLATADESAEHREKYSMGAGYYLKDSYRHRDGWQVCKQIIRAENKIKDIPTGEWCVNSAPVLVLEEVKSQNSRHEFKSFTLSPGTKAGFIQIEFNSKPDRHILEELKSAGFRWSSFNKVWYGKKDSLPGRYNTEAPNDEPPKPTRKPGEQKAEALRAKAEAMQPAINQKMQPACSMQNPTARRARMAEGMRADGEALQRVQAILNGLADMHEAGTITQDIEKLESKTQIESLLDAKRIGFDKLAAHDCYTETRYRLARAGISAKCDYEAAFYQIEQIEKGAPMPDPIEKTLRQKEADLIGLKIDGFFPTPNSVIEKMLDYMPDDFGGEYVLEPSAGHGAIADAIKAHGGIPQCIEINSRLREILEMKGHALIAWDFNEYGGNQYKYIMQNPPFEKGQDIEHFFKSVSLLASGGTLACILGEGAFFHTTRSALAFQDFIKDCDVIDLEDAFNEKGQGRIRTTGARSRLVIFKKD